VNTSHAITEKLHSARFSKLQDALTTDKKLSAALYQYCLFFLTEPKSQFIWITYTT